MAKKGAKNGAAGKPQSEPRAKSGAKAKSGGGLGTNLVGLSVLLGLLFVVTPTALLLAVGMAPTLVAVFIDRTPGNYAARCVGACNLAGVLPALRSLWVEGHYMATAKMLLNDPLIWMQMYGAAAVGWFLFWGIPTMAVFFSNARRERQVKRLQDRQGAWAGEWGRGISEE